ncbi:MAG TPA: glycoside hydrolase family 76 protein [Bacteroidales bacterium]|nr:glycoside hydrolase family 76 protein [Bacteroidales bacterium]
MRRRIFNKIITVSLVVALGFSGFQAKPKNDDLTRAKLTLKQIFRFYDAGHDNLLNETYPVKPGNKVSYLAGYDTITGQRVAYLWPASGVFSGVNALLNETGDKQYLQMLEKKILPGLEQYYDSLRKPACYQSYVIPAGKSDRYYDDNIWLALDFCDLYTQTRKPEYLEKSVKIWQFVISGWDDKLGGGIYWCEQKKQSKNTCSNAPASVLAFKLFEATRDSSWFNRGLRIYNWTKTSLQDSTDYLYFDNKSLAGRIDKKKYTYNSGQMLQSAAMLYRLTGNKTYLEEAQHIAKSAIDYFTEYFTTAEGKKIRLFKNTGNWFNAILFRGYAELYRLDGNNQYLAIFRDNMDQLWNHVRNKDGLFSKDWKGEKEDEYKALLDQAGLAEIWAVLGR